MSGLWWMWTRNLWVWAAHIFLSKLPFYGNFSRSMWYICIFHGCDYMVGQLWHLRLAIYKLDESSTALSPKDSPGRQRLHSHSRRKPCQPCYRVLNLVTITHATLVLHFFFSYRVPVIQWGRHMSHLMVLDARCLPPELILCPCYDANAALYTQFVLSFNHYLIHIWQINMLPAMEKRETG